MFTSAAVTNVTIFHDGTTTLTVIVVPADADAALVVTSTSSGASTEILWAMLPPSPPSPPPGCVPSSPHAARQKDSASTAATATSAVMSFLFIEISSFRASYALTAIVSRDMPFVNAARHKFFSPIAKSTSKLTLLAITVNFSLKNCLSVCSATEHYRSLFLPRCAASPDSKYTKRTLPPNIRLCAFLPYRNT